MRLLSGRLNESTIDSIEHGNRLNESATRDAQGAIRICNWRSMAALLSRF